MGGGRGVPSERDVDYVSTDYVSPPDPLRIASYPLNTYDDGKSSGLLQGLLVPLDGV